MYTAKDFTHLLGLTGFSDTMLTNHFTLYNGYVNNINTMLTKFETLDQASMEMSELSRRFAWEYDGMKMHELYFGNMTKEKTEINKEGELYKKLISTYGSYEKWIEVLKAKGMMRGIGWVMLSVDTDNGELYTHWIREHEIGHMVGSKSLLIMDTWEHAYMTDYGLKKADYINMFINTIDWNVVESRYNA